MLDRQFQLEILEKLSEQYPKMYNFADNYPSSGADFDKALANIYYLQEHELISPNSVLEQAYAGGEYEYYLNIGRITHDGMDFLANDGGLRAILGTVTIKIQDEQLHQILAQHINQSDLSPVRKQLLLDELAKLPAESIKHLTNLLLSDVYQNPQAIVGTIQKFLHWLA